MNSPEDRQTQEGVRQTQEGTRQTTEGIRQTTEATEERRQVLERAGHILEAGKQSQEASRQTQEKGRQVQENFRQAQSKKENKRILNDIRLFIIGLLIILSVTAVWFGATTNARANRVASKTRTAQQTSTCTVSAFALYAVNTGQDFSADPDPVILRARIKQEVDTFLKNLKKCDPSLTLTLP